MSVNHVKQKRWGYNRLATAAIAFLLILASFASILLITSRVSAAGSIYITPATSSVVRGNTVTVSVRINPTTPVTIVEATVGFNPSSLQYVSIDTSGSPFDASIQQTVSSNNIKIARAKLDPAGISTDALIAKITFKALPYTGSSPITLTAANAAFDGSYTNPAATGATINFTPGTCPTGQVGTPPSCTIPVTPPITPPVTPPAGGGTTTPPKTTPPTTPSSSTPTPDKTTPGKTDASKTPSTSSLQAPVITSEDIQYTSVTINATTSIPARTYLVYGTASDALNMQTGITGVSASHSISIRTGITPGSTLYYQLIATSGQSEKKSEVRSVIFKGLSMRVALLDKDMRAIPNQKVSLDPFGSEAKSDNDGFVIFENLMPGDYTIKLVSGGQTHQRHLAVASNVEDVLGVQASARQSEAIIFDAYTAPAGLFPLWVWYVGGGSAAVFALVGLSIMSWRRNGIVRLWYNRLSNYYISQKMKGTVAGAFSPATGTLSNPAAYLGTSASTVPVDIPFSQQPVAAPTSVPFPEASQASGVPVSLDTTSAPNIASTAVPSSNIGQSSEASVGKGEEITAFGSGNGNG